MWHSPAGVTNTYHVANTAGTIRETTGKYKVDVPLPGVAFYLTYPPPPRKETPPSAFGR